MGEGSKLKRVRDMNIHGKALKGRLKIMWDEVVETEQQDMDLNRGAKWRVAIR